MIVKGGRNLATATPIDRGNHDAELRSVDSLSERSRFSVPATTTRMAGAVLPGIITAVEVRAVDVSSKPIRESGQPDTHWHLIRVTMRVNGG